MDQYSLAITQTGKIFGITKKMVNRHGLITGATGTGKTITLRKLAEAFSDDGIPVFLIDAKGDLSGLVNPGVMQGKVAERIEQFKFDSSHYFNQYPVTFWDIFGENGIPLRTTITEMDPLLLTRLLNLNTTQEGLLNLIFRVAHDQNLLLIDLKDLRALLKHVGENAKTYQIEYGLISTASIGAIQRALLILENQGAEHLFGEPTLNLDDWLQTQNGQGVINILNAEKLLNYPSMYSSMLLWLLSDLFEHLPEVGDLDKPKFVLFFDEAHLIFNNAPSVLIEKIEQIVRLIRSKGVGVYFVTQSPLDIPTSVLSQLGNRIQHALRAFTPKDQKIIKAVAQTFHTNPAIHIEEAIANLGVSEALISFLDKKGIPSPVEIAFIYPPKSQLNSISKATQKRYMIQSPLYPVYYTNIDNVSAFEVLQQNDVLQATQTSHDGIFSNLFRLILGNQKRGAKLTPVEKVINNIAKKTRNRISSKIAREITKRILNVLTKK